MTKPPAFQFYAKEWITGTMTLSLAERGFYISLLAYQWDKGGVPGDDLSAVARAANCERAETEVFWPKIQSHFRRERDGFWRNKKLKSQWRDLMAYRKLQSDKGKRGGRGKSRGKAAAFPGLKPGESPEKALRSTSTLQPPKPPTDAGGFLRGRDRRKAELMRRSHGMCPHSPSCQTYEQCLRLLASARQVAN